LARQQLDRFVAEPVIGPAEGRTRWLLAMTDTAGPIVIAVQAKQFRKCSIGNNPDCFVALPLATTD
jgi:hypothetical protein